MARDIASPLLALQPILRKVAVVRALHLGDLLLAVPALRALRRALPKAEITLIGLPWSRDFAQRFAKYIDRWVEFPGFPGILEVEFDEVRTATFLRESQAYGYDLAIQVHGDGSISNQFTAQLGARFTAGFRREQPDDDLITFSLPYPDGIAEVLKHLRLMAHLGATTPDARLEFPLQEADFAALNPLAELRGISTQLTIGVHPGARPPARRWATDRFAGLADRLAEEHSAQVIVLGGPGEEALANEVQAKMRTPAINLAGKLAIGPFAALLSRLALLVANDSGPAHLAEAVGTRSIVLFGPADSRRWAPLDQTNNRIIYKQVECSPCPCWECPIDHRCLERIQADEVARVAEDLLGGRP